MTSRTQKHFNVVLNKSFEGKENNNNIIFYLKNRFLLAFQKATKEISNFNVCKFAWFVYLGWGV